MDEKTREICNFVPSQPFGCCLENMALVLGVDAPCCLLFVRGNTNQKEDWASGRKEDFGNRADEVVHGAALPFTYRAKGEWIDGSRTEVLSGRRWGKRGRGGQHHVTERWVKACCAQVTTYSLCGWSGGFTWDHWVRSESPQEWNPQLC